MSNKHLTVGEVMEVLQSLPKDMPVLHLNAEYSDYDIVTMILLKDVELKHPESKTCTCYDDAGVNALAPVKAVIFS